MNTIIAREMETPLLDLLQFSIHFGLQSRQMLLGYDVLTAFRDIKEGTLLQNLVIHIFCQMNLYLAGLVNRRIKYYLAGPLNSSAK